jgi:transcriptional regulator GlxA family with amidase domain
VAPDRAAQRRGALIMRRAECFIATNPERPLSVAELCAAAGCSARTLDMLFRERTGMSPGRYLRTRRLMLARRRLLAADAAKATVAAIAAECGFWEFGRFSATYRAQYGEYPRETLHKPRDSVRGPYADRVAED